MAYTDELQDILRALNSGMPAPDAYELFQVEQDEMQARRQARREAKMAQAQAMAEQQDSLISALSGTAISAASGGASLSDTLAELAARSQFMGVQPEQAFALPQVEAGLRELYPPSQAPWAPGVTPPLRPTAPTSMRSVIAPAADLAEDEITDLRMQINDAVQNGSTKSRERSAVLGYLTDTYGPTEASRLLQKYSTQLGLD